ncbi:GNAT family N-acetyltransferase [Flavobacterium sp. DSP2-3-1]|uniref:GNAT family N-acetyltransferase n=1 Tax=unclassified Flavobacterium TaxID=196869 RepID=UPI003CE78656
MTIEHLNETKNGHFKAVVNQVEVGRMTYTWSGTDKFIIDHTEVNPDFSGQNVGKKLVLQAAQYARENNFKIVPTCSFAKSIFDKTKEIQDLQF